MPESQTNHAEENIDHNLNFLIVGGVVVMAALATTAVFGNAIYDRISNSKPVNLINDRLSNSRPVAIVRDEIGMMRGVISAARKGGPKT